MKKITLIAALLVALITNAQKVFDFTGSKNPGNWGKSGGAILNSEGVTPSADGLVLEFGGSGLIVLTSMNPGEAAYVAKTGDLMRITLVNNNTEVDVFGPLNDRNDGTNTGIQFYAINNALTPTATKGTGVEQVVTVALTANYKNDNGDSTLNDTDGVDNMERIGLRMGATAGLSGNNPFLTQSSADAGNIIIKKIEILSAGTTTLNSYDFSTDGITGFSGAIGSLSDVGTTLDFNSAGTGLFPRIDQTFFSVDAANKFLHIEVDSNVSDANLIGFRFTTAAGGQSVYQFQTLNTGGASTSIEIPLTREEWTGTITGWSILLRKDIPAVTFNTGAIKIASIRFDNTTLSTDDNILAKVSLYPNPANNVLNIVGINNISKIQLYDVAGKQILESKIFNNKLNISNLKSGVYFLKIQDSNKSVLVKRFIKQ